MDRQRELQLLVRRNRGRTEFKTYFEDLERLLAMKIADTDRLDLETTDQLFGAYTNGLQKSKDQPQHFFRKTWTHEPIRAWTVECDRIGGALAGKDAVLFVGPYEYCGAIRVAPNGALQAAASLLNFDGDTLRVGTFNASSGLYVDKYEEHSEWFVEFVVWGDWAIHIAPVMAS
jgi:hypothetical protein